ncbi:MAG: hypothetical protein HQ567_19635 [Candidatus Nealsonbacteria bacterium]|nr:hypothetical protein [Candidatus Nealsonbacteria bacterium]
MIIGPESPFRQLPSILDARQAAFLDAICYCVEMADLAHRRLADVLLTVSREFSHGPQPPDRSVFVSSFLDAWSIVDAVHRLRGLLEQMPQFKRGGSPTYQLFRRKSDAVESLRNIVQHLRGEIQGLATGNWPVFGVISWLAVLDEEEGIVSSGVMAAGRILPGSREAINPCSHHPRTLVDHVTLEHQSNRLSLSGTMKEVKKIVRAIEPSLKEQFSGHGSGGGDLLVCIECQLKPDTEDRDVSDDAAALPFPE